MPANVKMQRVMAIALTVVLILGSIVVGGARTFAGRQRRVIAVMDRGAKGDGVGISSDIRKRADTALTLVTLLSRHMPADDPLIMELSEAAGALSGARTPWDKLDANRRLTQAVDSAAATAQNVDSLRTHNTDAAQYRTLTSAIRSSNLTMQHDEYNTLARQFNSQIASFPGGFFAGLGGVKALPLFDQEAAGARN